METPLTNPFVRSHLDAIPVGHNDPELITFHDRFGLPLGDEEAATPAPFRPAPDNIYYVSLMNESRAQSTLPAGVEADIMKGLYRFSAPTEVEASVRVVGAPSCARRSPQPSCSTRIGRSIRKSGAPRATASSLAKPTTPRDGTECILEAAPQRSHLHDCLAGVVPGVAASDCVMAWPQLIAPALRAPFHALGIDGFGRSDTQAQWRRFFEVDQYQIALAALTTLREQHRNSAATCAAAIARYGIDSERLASWISWFHGKGRHHDPL
jgi:pyruvate dehydrogenase E1 component